MSSSMTPNDRETLSALFDGELEGDAARFAMRRLDHDTGWRDACSRWQLTGDVLRGQATGLAPAGFAQRVSAALAAEAAEAAPAAVVTGKAPRGAASSAVQAQSRRWWGRAALAASVAVAALFVTRPFSGLGDGDALPAGTPIAAIPAPSGTAPVDAVPEAGTPSSAPGGVAVAAAAAVAVADVPRRTAERRARVAAPSPRATAAQRETAPVTMALAATEPAARSATGAGSDPFKPQTGDLVTRPWPRAVLPGATAAGAFTASFGTAQSSPSFYPFEPDSTHAPRPAAEPAPQP